MPHAPFVHLRTHSSYSLAEGAIKVGDLVKLAVRHSMPALAITDSNNLFCSLEFSKSCADAGVQPIIGCTLKVDMQLKQTTPLQEGFDMLVLLAKDETGYRNLLRLVSKAYMETADEVEPHVTFSDLVKEKQNEGLIALTAGPKGTVGRLLLSGQHKEAESVLLTLKELFGDRLYIELMRHGVEEENRIEEAQIQLAYRHQIPLVATNEVFFAHKDMMEAHDALLCIADGRYVDEEDRRKLTPEYYFKSAEEMQALFADIPEAIANTLVIARRCAVKSESRNPILPRFDTGEGKDEAAALREESHAGLTMRLATQVFKESMSEGERKATEERYRKRLDYELDVIISMQFPGYFLIVSDFIRWSKRKGIPVGPGRGSGAGSVVAWSLEITDLDPLRFGLLFERFLNPERVSMPDFDVDFCQERRDEVISYVQKKYGKERVAQIITFGKLQARAVVRDVGRVLQMSYGQVDKISKMIPNNPANPITLAEAIKLEPMLRAAQEEDPHVAKLLAIALQLEGLNRHASTHAAGVVIADRPLSELVPLYRDPRSNMPVIQYSMKYAEMAGLVKFDFLGLKTLTVIADSCKLLAKRGIEIDISAIPLNDPATYAMLSRGETVGVFQFESAGMRDALRKMKPDTIEDLIALGALYRPGPMDNIPTYIACKHGLEEPDYLHPKLEGILKETFGVIIYQEQVMQIAQVLSGYSLGAADLLRRAMGKKIKEEMDAQRELFVTGAIEKGVDKQQASHIFDLVAKFAGYGFNKSHAAAYALISYQTAYLKANYPVEFTVASMNLDMHDTDKINVFFQDARFLKIPVLPVDINRSQALFSPENITHENEQKQAIRYALGALKNVGVDAVAALVAEREKKGAFTDIFDVAARGDSKTVNKRQLESLIRAGAFDGLHSNRRQLYEGVEMITRYNGEITRQKASNQISLFAMGEGDVALEVKPVLPQVPDWPQTEKLLYEKEAIGFYLSSHPLDHYAPLLAKSGVVTAHRLPELPDGTSKIRLAGIVSDVRMRVSARGRFAYVQLSDSTGVFEVAVFNETLLNESRELLESNTPVTLMVEARKDEGGFRLIADSIQKLDDLLATKRTHLTIWIDGGEEIAALQQLCRQDRNGNTTVSVIILTETRQITLAIPGTYSVLPEMVAEMQGRKGIKRVEIR